MLEHNLSKQEKNKQKRRKPWIRYERKHSLSAVHDASRKVLAAGEFDNATEENSLELLKRAIEKYEFLCPIFAVITDHGSRFYANKRDKKGNAKHGFEIFLKERGINQILCGVNHPQTNGKQEKFHDFYKNHRAQVQ